MDPALLRERDLFRKRALETPVIEARPRKDETSSPSEPKRRYTDKPGPSSSSTGYSAGSSSGYGQSQNYKFQVLSKIVKHLKNKFQEGEDSPLTLEEMLDETSQLDCPSKVRLFLLTEAFPSNPKMEETADGKYVFRPPLKCRDKKSLLRLLRLHDMKGLGGIFREDVIESIPHAERILKALDPDIITITRQDKKKVLFYRDKQSRVQVDEEFQKLWRSVAVDGIDDAKIEDYLEKAGIRSMEGQGIKKTAQKMKKSAKRKTIRKIKDNEHIAGDLKHYE